MKILSVGTISCLLLINIAVCSSFGLGNNELKAIFSETIKPVEQSDQIPDKVILIGFDGFSWRQIQLLIDEGKMPNFQELMKNGCAINLASTDFPSSAVSWPSIMTGCKPEKTGISSFFKLDPDSYKLVLNHSRFRKVKALWELASDAGKKCFSVNVPMSWPCDKIDGVMIAGLLSPQNEVFTFPESISKPLRDNGYVTGYRQFRQSLKFGGPAFADTGGAMDVNSLFDIAMTRYQVVQYLTRQMSWDLGIVVFTLVDRFQHNQGALGTPMIQHACKQMDVLLGGLMKSIPENTSIVVCSDHGFREYKHTFLMAEWLNRNGYINTNGKGQPIWNSTRIIPLDRVGNCGLYRFNVKDREKNGILSGDRKDQLIVSLKEQLSGLHDENGNRIVESISSLSGQNGSADILIKLRSDLLLNNSMDVTGNLYRTLLQSIYDHENAGVGLLYSPGKIAENKRIDASVFDISPTVLQLLGLDIPSNMDGKILKSAFVDLWLQQNKAASIKSSERKVQVQELRLEDNDVMTQLKALGYIN